MRTCNHSWRSAAATVEQMDTRNGDRPGIMTLPAKWNAAQSRAVPILNKFLLANPGSSFAEITAGVDWDRWMVTRYLQECRFPFTGSYHGKLFYAHGQRPVEA